MGKLLPTSKSHILSFAVTMIVLLFIVEVPEEPEYAEEEIQEYRDRMIDILNATEGCHDPTTYTSHFEKYDLANDVFSNLSEDGLITEETRGNGGLFGSRYTVYCPAGNLTQKIQSLNRSKLTG